jgi:hypothetical protein
LAVSYLTILDKYAIANIFILCLVACWHGVVASFWHPQQALYIDFWLTISIAIIIVLVNAVFVYWFFTFKINIWNLKKKENEYVKFHNDVKKGMLKITGSILNIKS